MMTRSQAFQILELSEGASLEEVKRSYRRLAFALHPDLNPDKPDAADRFKRLNEAYVFLGEALQPKRTSHAQEEAEATEKARKKAQQAYQRARSRQASGASAGTAAGSGAYSRRQEEPREKERDEVLRDLLRDPFARRVFEDIYSQIRHESARNANIHQTAGGKNRPCLAPKATGREFPGSVVLGKAVDSVHNWFLRQIDDEQTVYLPGSSLRPGARVRLQISHGLSGKAQTIEVALPPEFQPGKPIRLKGLGRRLGKWQGDLYLRILPKPES